MQSLLTFFEELENYKPLIRGGIAILIVIFGWILGMIANKIIVAILNKFHFNKALKRLGWKDALERAEFHIDGSRFFGKISEWIIFIIGMMLAFNVVGIDFITALLEKVVSYLPNIIISSLILIGAIFVSDFSYRIVIASTGKKISYSKVLGSVLRGFIWIFATLTILLQLGIAPEIIKAIVYGLIGAIALAFGIAFGLGGKDFASGVLKGLRDKFF